MDFAQNFEAAADDERVSERRLDQKAVATNAGRHHSERLRELVTDNRVDREVGFKGRRDDLLGRTERL